MRKRAKTKLESLIPLADRAAFAERVECSTLHLSRICRGKMYPGVKLAARMADALGGAVTIQELLGFDGSRERIAS